MRASVEHRFPFNAHFRHGEKEGKKEKREEGGKERGGKGIPTANSAISNSKRPEASKIFKGEGKGKKKKKEKGRGGGTSSERKGKKEEKK